MCRCKRHKKRKAAAVIELAICLPVIFLLIFGSMQACNLIFLKQTVTAAAYEGILVAVRPQATEAATSARIEAVFTARGVTGGTTSVQSPGNASFTDIGHGEEMSLTVTVPAAENLFGPMFFTPSNNVSVTVSAYKQ